LTEEKSLTKSSQQLAHACQMYFECLNSVVSALNDQSKGGKKLSRELQNLLENVNTQVRMDQNLLDEISSECQSILSSKSKYGFVSNMIISATSKRAETLKVLENKLVSRTQILTSMMLQDVWRSNRGLDEEFIEMVGDLEAAVFWNSNFGVSKQISLRSFLEAFQKYVCDTYKYRLLEQMQMLTLLRYTILEDAATGSSNAILLNTEISVAAFGTFIKRYGPMRDTLYKCAAVTNPTNGQPAKWFHRQMSRDSAAHYIESNLRSLGSAIQPDNMFVVRYSSDPRNHFVISVKSPVTQTVEHFAVANTPMGYSLAGEEQIFSLTLHDCIQNYIFDKLFTKATGQQLTLSRDAMDAWDAIFLTAVENRIYEDGASFKKSIQNLSSSTGPAQGSGGFGSIFVSNGTDGSSSSQGSPDGRGHEVVPSSEKSVIGRYMIEHGLQLLLESGSMNPIEAEQVRRLAFKC
jgi:hypothetical protein